MKRLLLIITAFFLAVGAASAQEGLFVEDLFEGNVISLKDMKRTFISGSKLQPYGLDMYKSIRFRVNDAQLRTVESLVIKDASGVEDKTTIYTGDRLTYAVICLPKAHNGLNRFLCYQAKQDRRRWNVTVVYLRGTATVEDLNDMFNKRK